MELFRTSRPSQNDMSVYVVLVARPCSMPKSLTAVAPFTMQIKFVAHQNEFGFCCTAPIQHWIVDYFGGEGSFAVWPSTPLFTRVAGHSSREMLVLTVDTRLSLKPLRGIRCGSRFSSCSPEPDQSGLVCVLVARTSLLVWGNTRTPDLPDVGSSLGVKLTRGARIDRHIVRRSPGSLRHVVLQACRLCESAHAGGLRSRCGAPSSWCRAARPRSKRMWAHDTGVVFRMDDEWSIEFGPH